MTPQELLSRFLAKDDHREFFKKPILRGDFIYATNGNICIRIPACQGVDAIESDKPAGLSKIFEESIRDNFRMTFPTLPPAKKCKPCNGSGIGYKCPTCDGEGSFDYKGHDYDCKECDGSGQVDDGKEENKQPCWFCSGDGVEQQQMSVDFQDFDRRYLAKISDLPGIRIALNETDPDSGAAYFVWDGGEGVLMPMRK